MTEQDFGDVIDATIVEHRRKPISDQALFLSILAPWFALGFTGIAIALYQMIRS